MKMRTCGICGVENIPRGVDWPCWLGGRPVHIGCYPIYPPEVKEKMKFYVEFEYNKPDNLTNDSGLHFPDFITGKIVIEAVSFGDAENHFEDMKKEIGSLAGMSIKLNGLTQIHE